MTEVVQTKTVRETTITTTAVMLWRPEPSSVGFCGCVDPEPDADCPECLGTGTATQYRDDPDVIDITNAVVVEVQGIADEVDLTADWIPLNFECSFQTHIYPECCFELAGHFWKVMDVETEADPEEDFPFLHHWTVLARRLQPYEPTYVFLSAQAEAE